MNEEDIVLPYVLDSLFILGLHPVRTTCLSKLRTIGTCLIFFTVWSMNFLGIITGSKSLDSIQNALDSFPSVHQLTFKIIFIVVWRKQHATILKKLKYFWTLEGLEPALADGLTKMQAKFNYFFKLYRLQMYFTAYIFILRPLVAPGRPFPIGWYIPCDTADNYCYFSFYLVQSLYIVFAAFCMLTMDFLFFVCVFLLYCEFEKVKYKLRNVEVREDVDGDERVCLANLSRLVQQHNFALRYVKDMSKTFHFQLLNQFVTTMSTICFGIYFFNKDISGNLSYVPYLLFYHIQLFMYCFAGENISKQAEAVAMAAYDSKWYVKRQPKYARGVLLVIQNANRPARMLIGGIWNLNILTFFGVVKTSFSFNTFLQTMNTKPQMSTGEAGI